MKRKELGDGKRIKATLARLEETATTGGRYALPHGGYSAVLGGWA